MIGSRNWALRVVWIVTGIAIVVGAIAIYKRPRTPEVRGEDGRRIAGAVASLERVVLGDAPQWILVRGDPSKPLVLFLHGGPGMPMMWMAHRFQRPLEDEFLLVHWDQRGAGKSFASPPPISSMSDEQILSDALELVDTLRSRYGKDRVLVVGHSWGTRIGALLAERRPDLLSGYVGVGQVTGSSRRDSIVESWLRERASAMEDTAAIGDLEVRGEAAYEKWLFRYGGELYGETNYMSFIWTGLRAPEYGLMDVLRVGQGSSWSSAHMRETALEGRPLHSEIRCLAVPVWLFHGKQDYVTPSALSMEWLSDLRAPAKSFVWFERSAHFPHYEQPAEFQEALRRVSAAVEAGGTVEAGYCSPGVTADTTSSARRRSANATRRNSSVHM